LGENGPLLGSRQWAFFVQTAGCGHGGAADFVSGALGAPIVTVHLKPGCGDDGHDDPWLHRVACISLGTQYGINRIVLRVTDILTKLVQPVGIEETLRCFEFTSGPILRLCVRELTEDHGKVEKIISVFNRQFEQSR
jgi:hypothetical protein